jgi:hypothetical protein
LRRESIQDQFQWKELFDGSHEKLTQRWVVGPHVKAVSVSWLRRFSISDIKTQHLTPHSKPAHITTVWVQSQDRHLDPCAAFTTILCAFVCTTRDVFQLHHIVFALYRVRQGNVTVSKLV